MNKLKNIILGLLLVVLLAGLVFFILNPNVFTKKEKSGKIQVVSSNFASYDFLRAITKDTDNIEVTFLMGPGKDAHSFEPTAQDLIKIQDASLFVYIGGEMEKWSDKVIDAMESDKNKVVRIADFVDTIDEEEVDGAEEHEHEHEHEEHEEGEEHEEHEHEHEEGAFDEHIWTSPSNAIKMVNALESKIEELDKENSEKYKKNAEECIKQINEVDSEIKEIVSNKKRDRLIFGDKMPMQYFINYYDLKVSAAFNGCSTETDPSAATIAYLENKIKEENIPVVLYIELNNGRVANTIANETGCKAMQIQALHNVSLDDFNNGETWVSLMKRNVNVLKAALQ